jgi:hypothetical protein
MISGDKPDQTVTLGSGERRAQTAAPDPRVVVKVLERAAELVERGWCQGHVATTEAGTPCTLVEADRVCAMGAILLAIKELDVWSETDPVGMPISQYAASFVAPGLRQRFDQWSDYLRSVVPSHSISLSMWNDAKGRTADEVASEMRAAAKRLAPGQS